MAVPALVNQKLLSQAYWQKPLFFLSSAGAMLGYCWD